MKIGNSLTWKRGGKKKCILFSPVRSSLFSGYQMLDLCGMSVVRSEAEKKLAEADFCRTDLYCDEKWVARRKFLVWKGFDILGAVERNQSFFLYEEINVFFGEVGLESSGVGSGVMGEQVWFNLLHCGNCFASFGVVVLLVLRVWRWLRLFHHCSILVSRMASVSSWYQPSSCFFFSHVIIMSLSSFETHGLYCFVFAFLWVFRHDDPWDWSASYDQCEARSLLFSARFWAVPCW